MEIDKDVLERIQSVSKSDSEVFSDLVRLSNLDPSQDFQGADLRGVDFNASNLEGFNFSTADLRGANWNGSEGTPNVRGAMLGNGTDALVSRDFHALSQSCFSLPTWGERFSAFAAIIDNFGISDFIIPFVSDALGGSKSAYQRDCSFAYLAGSYIGQGEAMDYCRKMAYYGNSQINMFRIAKVRRYCKEFTDYLLILKEGRQRFPSEVEPAVIARLYHSYISPNL